MKFKSKTSVERIMNSLHYNRVLRAGETNKLKRQTKA